MEMNAQSPQSRDLLHLIYVQRNRTLNYYRRQVEEIAMRIAGSHQQGYIHRTDMDCFIIVKDTC